MLGQAKPNIVHIFADDLGYGGTGYTWQNQRAANGLPAIATPNIDALARGGMIFNNAYTATVCGPSRGSLYSGFHNGHTLLDRNGNIGVGFRTEDITVAEVLKTRGYSTSLYGKWGVWWQWRIGQ